MFIFTQDNLDVLRQEYVDYNAYYSAHSMGSLTIPARIEFTMLQPPALYSLLLGNRAEPNIHDWHIFGNLVTNVTNLDNAYTGVLNETSGYRCPRGNYNTPNRSTTSNHQYGLAVDWAQGDSEQNYRVWEASANAANRFLYSQDETRLNENAMRGYVWPQMPLGVTSYMHGHTDW